MASAGSITIFLGANTLGLKRGIADMKKFERQVGASATRITASMASISLAFKSTGAAMARFLTLPLAIAGGAGLATFSKFEFELSKVTGLVGIADKQTQKWGDAILKLAPKVGKMPVELAEGLYFVTSAGIRGAETMQVLEYAAKASAVGMGEVKVIANTVAAAMNAYGKENLSAAQATDILTMTIREGMVEADKLAPSLGQVLPIAADMGVTFDEVGAAIAGMTRTGTKASTAGQQLRMILAKLLKPANQSKEAIAKMNSSFAKLRKTIKEKGLLAALTDLKGMTAIFGKEVMADLIPRIRPLIGVMDLIGQNFENNKIIFKNTADAVGTLDKAFLNVTYTLRQKWNMATAGINVAMIELGRALKQTVIPMITSLMEKAMQLANWFRSLSKEQARLLTKMILWGAIVGPILLLIGSLIGAVGKIIITFIGLRAGILKTIAIMKLYAASMVTGNIATKKMTLSVKALDIALKGIYAIVAVLIVGAVFMLNTAVWALVQTFDTVVVNFKMGWNTVLLETLKIVKWFQDYDWKSMFAGMWEGFMDFVDNFAIKWVEGFEKGVQLIKRAIKATPDFMRAFDPTGGGATSIYDYMTKEEPKEKQKVTIPIKELTEAEKKLSKIDQAIIKLTNANSAFAESIKGKESFGEAYDRNLKVQLDYINKLKNDILSMLSFGDGSVGGIGSGSEREIIRMKKMKKLTTSYNNELMDMHHLYVAAKIAEVDLFELEKMQAAQKQFDDLNWKIEKLGGNTDLLNEKLRLQKKVLSDLLNMKKDDIANTDEWIASIGLARNEINATNEVLAVLELQLMGNMGMLDSFGQALYNIGNVFSDIGGDGALGKFGESLTKVGRIIGNIISLIDAVKTITLIYKAVTQATIPGIVTETVATKALAGAQGLLAMNTAIAKAAMMGYPALLATIPTAMATVGAALAAGAAMSMLTGGPTGLIDGGIIPSGYPNDSFNARLTSNEAVIPLDRLPELLGLGDNMGDKKEVRFLISGRALDGTLEKENKFKSIF